MESANKVPLVYITVVNYNGKQDTSECLDSIQRLEYGNWKTLVIDNGSEDDSAAYLKTHFPEIEVIENHQNVGFGQGQNVGIQYALAKGAEYVLVLNNDTVVSPSVLTVLLEVMTANPSIGIAGPKALYYDQKDRIWFAGGKVHLALGNTRNIGMHRRDSDGFQKVIDEDYQTGCALLLRREVIEKVGMFDPGYFAYWEDTDLCLRARRQGYRVVCVQHAKIWHKVSATTGGGLTPEKAYLKARGGVKFFRRFTPRLCYYTTVPSFALAYMVITSLLERCKGRRGIFMAYLHGFLDGRRELQVDREKTGRGES